MKRPVLFVILSTILVTAFAAGAQIISSNMVNVGTVSGNLPIANGGTGVTYGAPQTTLILNPTTSYSPPAGATWLDVCVASPGGGGGAATSGGVAAEAGGGGGSGSISCGIFRHIISSYVTQVGLGGTAGTCSGAPTVAGDGSATTQFIANSDNANDTLVSNFGIHGATAGTGAGGAGGAGGGAVGATAASTAALLNRYINTAGATGTTGVAAGDVFVYGGFAGGSAGGNAATVTSGGVCSKSATPGNDGYIIVRAYFN